MPGMSGHGDAEATCAQRGFAQPVIVLTATGGIDTVVAAMQAGACDFFVKPASPERIIVSIRNALSHGRPYGRGRPAEEARRRHAPPSTT